MQIVSLSFFRFCTPLSRLWALGMMAGSRIDLPRVPGIGFWKVCGSGTGEGFSPWPNTAVYALLATWPDAHTAREGVAHAKPFIRYRARAEENWSLFLTPISTRGQWSRQTPFAPRSDTGVGPIAALTRATLRPSIAARFWRCVPDISTVIGADPNVMFKIGIGEWPLLHQITFSIWPDTETMANFARADGPHARAIRAVRDGKWFQEELYARFRIHSEQGTWDGRAPRILKDQAA